VNERPFPDKSIKPAPKTLQAALGSAHAYYEKVLALSGSYSREWNFTKSSGWILKVYDSKKALFYLIPLNGGFKISLTLRGDERDAFLCDAGLRTMHDRIASSKKFPEGFALQFDIGGKKEFQPLELFITKLIALRT
jgi:hypothetical protein